MILQKINRMEYSVPVSIFYTVFGSKIEAPGHFGLDLTMALKYDPHHPDAEDVDKTSCLISPRILKLLSFGLFLSSSACIPPVAGGLCVGR